MKSLKFECLSSNRLKLQYLIEHYRGCDHLILYINDLQRRYSAKRGLICLEEVFQRHVNKAYWMDIGGEAG